MPTTGVVTPALTFNSLTELGTYFTVKRGSQQAQGPKTPRPIRIEQCFPTGVVRTWYGVCTE